MALHDDRRTAAKQLAEQGIAESRGGEFSVRFELLQALASGNAPGNAEQLEAVKAFAAKHSNTPQARYAQDVLAAAQRLEVQQSQLDSPATPAETLTDTASNAAYTVSKGEFWVAAALPAGGKIQEQKFSLTTFCVDWNVNLNLEVYDSMLNENTMLLTVKTFENEASARAFARALEKEQPIEGVKLTVMPISPENFSTMVEQKSFSGYLNFYRRQPFTGK